MSQSPIKLAAIDSKTLALNALPLQNPEKLFCVDYSTGTPCTGDYDEEPKHGNFILSSPGPTVWFRSHEYELKKIHIHSIPEHKVEVPPDHSANSHRNPITCKQDEVVMEVHLIHIPKGSKVESPLLVIGVMFVEEKSPAVHLRSTKSFESLIQPFKGETASQIDPLDFFPADSLGNPITKDWFHYEGSLTSYPYSEVVSWFVMSRPGGIETSILKVLKAKVDQDARPLQPLNRRLVVRSFGVNADEARVDTCCRD